MRDLAHTLTLGLEPLLALQHLDEIIDASRPDDRARARRDRVEAQRIRPTTCSPRSSPPRHDGDRLSADELVDQVSLLFVAGHETTVNLIGNGTLALLRNRAQLERWRDDPSLDTTAVDELLRYDAPVQFSRRVTTADARGRRPDHRGGRVRADVPGVRQPRPDRWGDDATALDLTRPGAAQHLSFGSGVHHCLGAALARLEGRIALGTLVRRFPDLELATDTPEWNGRLVLRGLDTLPVSLG